MSALQTLALILGQFMGGKKFYNIAPEIPARASTVPSILCMHFLLICVSVYFLISYVM